MSCQRRNRRVAAGFCVHFRFRSALPAAQQHQGVDRTGALQGFETGEEGFVHGDGRITREVEHNQLIYGKYLNYFFRQGLNGRPCVLRALCEAKQILGRGGGLMEDIFYTLFTQVNIPIHCKLIK